MTVKKGRATTAKAASEATYDEKEVQVDPLRRERHRLSTNVDGVEYRELRKYALATGDNHNEILREALVKFLYGKKQQDKIAESL